MEEVVDQKNQTSADSFASEGESVSSGGQEQESGYDAAYVEQLQIRIKQAEEQAEKLQSLYKQAQADMKREIEETKQRLQKHAEARLETAKGELFQKIIDIADNLELALASAETADKEALIVGIKATYNLILRQLESEGVRQVNSLGEGFNPTLHEAIDMVEVEPSDDGKVLGVYKQGYRHGD
ncbi:MAG: nucleotide exchange factor GrpE, partial [Blastocatellia bacterium]|nr:nucleotide exchange factor GrpE [Blastocatellia bacterium]